MDEFFTDTNSDDTASMDDMTGPASEMNQAAAKGSGYGTATRGLWMLWLAVLLLYWGTAYLFRRQLS